MTENEMNNMKDIAWIPNDYFPRYFKMLGICITLLILFLSIFFYYYISNNTIMFFLIASAIIASLIGYFILYYNENFLPKFIALTDRNFILKYSNQEERIPWGDIDKLNKGGLHNTLLIVELRSEKTKYYNISTPLIDTIITYHENL